ncbi:S1C family serine protease [Sulfurovum sp. TSL1]|uniref:S1C family serine protease n=1 Tax=Sulfurovum sp. TSL1 TaxID=2826994 RepID=UPI001CC34F0C|nr:trypsin-like peptidase domain-containing protein [Sulfurovum sp. TSL1]GIT98002.1 2-alkenal reductase [Sulfurovum sp. TSL1]
MEKDFDGVSLLRSIRILLLILIILLALFVFLPIIENIWASMHSEPRSVTARGELSLTEKSNIEIFQESSPSVVYITTLEDTLNLWTRDITRIPRGTGSGFIWDRQGHVVTNYHVLQGASAVRIRLSDHRTFNATLVGASPEHDLAVLRIPMTAHMPKPLSIGTSHDLQVGQMTYAIGNPFGLDQTLTTGVVSALNRSLRNNNGSSIEDLIQTDAAINPGNSGGPLLDSAGRLIGINTAMFSLSGTYAGIGFAVPVDTVNRIVPQIIKVGHYQRPKLGITINESLNKEITKELGISGVAVIEVQPNSAAQRSGLNGVTIKNNTIISGDVIVAIDQHKVENTKMLLSTLEKYHIGDTVEVKFIRNDQAREVSLTLE